MSLVDRQKFDLIKSKYGHYASWAIWDEAGSMPKSNVGNLQVLDPDKNDSLLSQLNSNVVMVGLNISGKISVPLGNFHAKTSSAQDYKIRYAFQGTQFWGAYMTDIIKDFEEKVSGKMMKYMKENPSFLTENIQIFLEELNDLEAKDPVLIAFGVDTFNLLKSSLGNRFNIKKVTHYSHFISKEQYRDEVLNLTVNS